MHVCGECGERSEAPGTCPRDAQPLAPADDPLVGTDVGRYRIARRLAVGGMGRVYLGIQPEIGSRVAVKVLTEQCAEDPELVERFFDEARAVNMIAHESIVNIVDLATLADGRPYIVMEYIEGVTLTRAVRGGRAPLGGVVRMIADVLSALGAAHEIGIVHRDLKPDNILITAQGHAKVLDFGIAKLSTPRFGSAARTVTGALLGTPAYMAPEQISGARDVDARADLYAVGAVLFHAVTGRAPFTGTTMFDVMRAQLEEQPPAPRSLRPDLPIAVEHVIVRALAKHPEARFASAAEMAVALDEAAGTLPDDQWFDLSRATRPLRVRGSGARLTPAPARTPAPRRETPPAMSAQNLPAQRRRGPRLVIALATTAAVGVAIAVGVTTSRPRSAPAAAAVGSDAAAVATAPDAAGAAPDAGTVAVDRAAPEDVSTDVTTKVAAEAAPPARPRKVSTPRADRPRRHDTEVAGGAAVARSVWATKIVGPLTTKLTLRATYALAASIARGHSDTRSVEPVSIEIASDDPDRVFDLARRSRVVYRFVLDPPHPEACHAIVTLAKTITVRLAKGNCTIEDSAQHWPPRCDFPEVWAAMLETSWGRVNPVTGLVFEGHRWASNGSYGELPDDCQ